MPAAIQRIHVIVNPAAGQDRPILGPMNRAFHPAGIEWDVFLTRKAGDARRYAEQAVASGVDAVAVYGGDGTVTEVAGGLAGSQVPLAIFPGGTANVMSVELGIPGDLEEALALVSGERQAMRKVDLGLVNDRPFLLRVGLGLEAEMVQGADRDLKDRLGVLAYGMAAARALTQSSKSRYCLRIDGRRVETDGTTCMIANTGSMGTLAVSFAPDIDVSDGLLDVVVIREASLPSLAEVAASIVAGNTEANALEHWQGREIDLHVDPPQSLQADGEPLGEAGSIRVRVLPGAVSVIVPRSADAR